MSAGLAQALRDGPTPVPEAIRRCEEILASGLVDQHAEVLTTLCLAYLKALTGDITAARELCRQAKSSLADLKGRSLAAAPIATMTLGRIELLAGDAAAAAAEFRRGYEALGEIGERYFRPLIGALLAEALVAGGLHHNAMQIASEVEAIAPDDDLEAQAICRGAKAQALAADGRLDEALQLV